MGGEGAPEKGGGPSHDAYFVRMKKGPKLRTTAIIAAANSAEHIDLGLLTSMYMAIGCALRASPSQVGTLTMYRGLVAAIVSPFAGILGDTFDRAAIISVGSMLWGCMGVGMGFSSTFQMATAFAALNGIGIALVAPAVNSVVADLYTPEKRGRAFGIVLTVTALVGMLGSFYSISVANRLINGTEGWRVAFFTVAALSAIIVPLTWWGVVEPRRMLPKELQGRGIAEGLGFWTYVWLGVKHIALSVWEVVRVPSFVVLCVEHLVGTISFQAGYKILYFQLLGFSDMVVATIQQCTTVGVAIGFIVGGLLGDMLSKRFPNQARPFVNQLSLILALPLQVVLFKGMPGTARKTTGIPGGNDKFGPIYGVLLFCLGTLASWAAANNSAMFAEIVPSRLRSAVFAFDKFVAGLLGALSAPLVGVLAERVFGYNTKHRTCPNDKHKSTKNLAQGNKANALALENGLLWVFIIPTVIKLVAYSLLYWTLPRDRICNEDYIEASMHGGDLEAKLAEDFEGDDLPQGGSQDGGAGEKEGSEDSIVINPLADDERVEVINPFAQFSASVGAETLSGVNPAIFEVVPMKRESALPVRMLSVEMANAHREARNNSSFTHQTSQPNGQRPPMSNNSSVQGGQFSLAPMSQALPLGGLSRDVESGGYGGGRGAGGRSHSLQGPYPPPAGAGGSMRRGSRIHSLDPHDARQAPGELTGQLSTSRPNLASNSSLRVRMASMPALDVTALRNSFAQQ